MGEPEEERRKQEALEAEAQEEERREEEEIRGKRGGAAWQFLLHPPRWFWICCLLLGAACVPLSIWAALHNFSAWYVYVLYAVSALFLFYDGICMVKVSRRTIIRWLRAVPATARMMENAGYRATVFTIGTLTFNFAFSLYHIVLSVLNRSVWLGALAAYYFVLGGVRAVTVAGSYGKRRKEGKEHLVYDAKAYLFTGAVVNLLGLTLTGLTVLVVHNGAGFAKRGMMIYVFALYTVQKVVSALIKLVKAKKRDDYIVRAIRNVGVADAALSVLSLQTAMLAQFNQGELDARLFNAVTAGIVCAITLWMGSYMIVRGTLLVQERKKFPDDSPPSAKESEEA